MDTRSNLKLIEAVKMGRPSSEILKLIDAKADINTKDAAGNTALLWAAKNAEPHYVNLLIDAKADVNIKDSVSKTPLMHIAGQPGTTSKPTIVDSVKALLAAKVEVDATAHGKTALMFASISGNEDTIQALLAANADVNAKDASGKTPLLYATDLHSIKTYMYKRDEYGNRKVLWESCPASNSTHAPHIRALISAKADVTVRDNNGKTALMYACQKNDLKSVAVLIEAKVDVNAVDVSDNTALFYSAESIRGKFSAGLLIDAKADIHAKNRYNETAIFAAIKSHRSGVVELLLSKKADLMVKNDMGQRPLEYAEALKLSFPQKKRLPFFSFVAPAYVENDKEIEPFDSAKTEAIMCSREIVRLIESETLSSPKANQNQSMKRH